MFEIGGQYANRKGKYTVLEINEPKMTVQYLDGSTAELNMAIQHRIWENIVAEEEIKISRSTRAAARAVAGTGRFYIRPVMALAAEEMTMRGWKEQVKTAEALSMRLDQGDRIIYYVIENQVYFAVATITAHPTEPTKKELPTDAVATDDYRVFPLDFDALAPTMELGVTPESIELESQPDIKRLLRIPYTFIPITEDEFELLAEMLTEVAEDEFEEEEEELEDEEEFED